MSTPEQNKQIVMRLYDAFRAGDANAFDKLIATSYVQHNPQVGNGVEAIKAFLGQVGPMDIVVHRAVVEGDLVAVHSHLKTWNMAAVDIFRIGNDGKIVEHWDVLQAVPDTTTSGNDMFSQLS